MCLGESECELAQTPCDLAFYQVHFDYNNNICHTPRKINLFA